MSRSVRAVAAAALLAAAPALVRADGVPALVPTRVLETGPASQVHALAFSPDSRALAAGCDDGLLRVWALPSGEARAWQAHQGSVGAVAMFPDGRALATGGQDRAIRLWDLASGRLLATLGGHGHEVVSLAVSPDGRALVSASLDGTVRTWSLPEGRETGRIGGRWELPRALAFRPQDRGLLLATGGEASLWPPPYRERSVRLAAGSRPILALACTPDGLTLATGGEDKAIGLWTLPGALQVASLAAHAGSIRSLAWSPDGQTLASGSFDKTARLWSASGDPVALLAGHRDTVSAVAFSPDGQTVATGSLDGTLRFWPVPAGERRRELLSRSSVDLGLEYAERVALSPDGRTLATQNHSGDIKLWDLAQGRVVRTLASELLLARFPLSFSRDGRLLTSAGDDRITQWSVREGTRLARLDLAHPPEPGESRGLDSHLACTAVSPDGRLLATGGWDHTARLWALPEGRLVATLDLDERPRHVSFSPDGRTLATSAGSVQLWSVPDGKLRATLPTPTRAEWHLFSADGRTLAARCRGARVLVWSLQERKLPRMLDSSGEGLALSPDGSLVASSGALWSVADGTLLLLPESGPCLFAFAPGGRLLATSHTDGAIRLWQMPGPRIAKTLRGHAGRVSWLAFTPDGRALVSASAGSLDGTLRLWDIARD